MLTVGKTLSRKSCREERSKDRPARVMPGDCVSHRPAGHAGMRRATPTDADADAADTLPQIRAESSRPPALPLGLPSDPADYLRYFP